MQNTERFSMIINGKKYTSNSWNTLDKIRKQKNVAARIDDNDNKKPRALRADNTKEQHTQYGRQKEEGKYNNLTFKQAYNKARQEGVKYFGYKGKVYQSDLENGKDNMTQMMRLYGNNLGYTNDPRLFNQASTNARKQYRSQLSVQKPKVNKEQAERERVKRESAAKLAKTIDAASFADAILPTNAIGNAFDYAVDQFTGDKYTPAIHRSGFNPFGYAQDAANGNVGGLLVRGVDTYASLGAPGMSEGIDYLGTRFAPRIGSIGNKSIYLTKKATEPVVTESGEIIGRQHWRGALNALTGENIPAGGHAFGKHINSYGTRSVQRAINEGALEPLNATTKGNITRYANAAWRNSNTGTTDFFRNIDGAGNLVGNAYDNAIERGMQIAPYYMLGVDATGQILDSRKSGGKLISRDIVKQFKNRNKY